MSGRTTDEYIHNFQIWVIKSGITDNLQLIEWFITGLNWKLSEQIFFSESSSTTIREWFSVVSRMDNNYQKGQAITQQHHGTENSTDQKKKFFFKKPASKYMPDLNEMDWTPTINQMMKEHDKHIRRGMCFKCHQLGYIAHDCGKETTTRQDMMKKLFWKLEPEKFTNTNDAFMRLRAIYKELPEKEQDRLYNLKLEEEDF